MSIKGKAQINVAANFSSGTTARLQSQLTALGKRLYLPISNVKIQNKQFNKSIQDGLKQVAKSSQTATNGVVKNNQKTIDSIDKLISWLPDTHELFDIRGFRTFHIDYDKKKITGKYNEAIDFYKNDAGSYILISYGKNNICEDEVE